MKKVFIIDKKFNDGVTCTQSYALAVKKSSDVIYSPVESQFSSPVSFDNLEDDTAYDFKITRICCGGVVANDVIISLTTTNVTDPDSFNASPFSATQIDLSWSWDGVAPAHTGYSLERGLLADYSDAEEIYNGASTSFSDTGLTTGTTYYYRIRAYATGYLASDFVTDSATTP